MRIDLDDRFTEWMRFDKISLKCRRMRDKKIDKYELGLLNKKCAEKIYSSVLNLVYIYVDVKILSN